MAKIDDGDFFQVEKNEQFFRELEEDEKKNDFILEQLVCLLIYARKLILEMDSEERERTKANMLKIREDKSEAENKIIHLVEVVAMKFRDKEQKMKYERIQSFLTEQSYKEKDSEALKKAVITLIVILAALALMLTIATSFEFFKNKRNNYDINSNVVYIEKN